VILRVDICCWASGDASAVNRGSFKKIGRPSDHALAQVGKALKKSCAKKMATLYSSESRQG